MLFCEMSLARRERYSRIGLIDVEYMYALL